MSLRVWLNNGTGTTYRVTPQDTLQNDSGYCREYIMQAFMAGRRQRTYGTACRGPDGSWRIVHGGAS